MQLEPTDDKRGTHTHGRVTQDKEMESVERKKEDEVEREGFDVKQIIAYCQSQSQFRHGFT